MMGLYGISMEQRKADDGSLWNRERLMMDLYGTEKG